MVNRRLAGENGGAFCTKTSVKSFKATKRKITDYDCGYKMCKVWQKARKAGVFINTTHKPKLRENELNLSITLSGNKCFYRRNLIS